MAVTEAGGPARGFFFLHKLAFIMCIETLPQCVCNRFECSTFHKD
jgi:hypothetical protein